MEASYWVVAEIGEIRTHQNGHCYLDLVEKKSNKVVAKSRGTIWSYTYTNISRSFTSTTGMKLASGMNILVNASIKYHEVYGLSLNINDIDPNFTIGERERKRQEVISMLEKNGMLEMNAAIELPVVPQRIAVISSSSAAGYGDFDHQLTNNTYGYKIQSTLFNASVQGDNAANDIINQLAEIEKQQNKFDLIAIIRGGGAQTDFDCFDDYELCKKIAEASVPIITGIGHERDSTIADMTAHTSMKTPTAAAEFILSGFITYDTALNNTYERIASNTHKVLHKSTEVILELIHRLNLTSQKSIYSHGLKLDHLSNSIKEKSNRIMTRNYDQIALLEQKAISFDPELILQRGFTITTVNGINISKAKVKKGDVLVTRTKNAKVVSKAE